MRGARGVSGEGGDVMGGGSEGMILDLTGPEGLGDHSLTHSGGGSRFYFFLLVIATYVLLYLYFGIAVEVEAGYQKSSSGTFPVA